jgi:transposase
MLRRHWPNIETFFTHRITNAGAESMNSKIQTLKILARGFRNRERFTQAIYFHFGGLALYPESLPGRR